MTTERDKLYHYIFTTALEGGIGYWSVSTNYHWSTPNGGTYPYDTDEDWTGFYSDIIEFSENEDDWEAPENPRHRVDRKAIVRGLRRLADKTYHIEHLSEGYRKKLVAIYRDPEDADYDSADADIIVQVGVLGEVRYG